MDNLKSKAKLSIKQIVVICFVFAVSAALFITGSYFMLYEPDPGTTKVPFITDTTPATGDNTGSPSTTDVPPTYVPVEKKSYNFLVIGHDRVAVLADVIMLVNYNVTDGEVAIMQIPRDTHIDGDGSYTQINVAFSQMYAKAYMNGSKNPTLDAANGLASLLEKNLCININYSAVMNLDGFINIVDIIGGVEMNVPYDLQYEDEFQNLYINIKAGYQTLNGAQAEGFVRYRHNYVQADIGRENAQKIFMAAFMKKLISSIDVSSATQIAGQVFKNVTTDLKVDDIVYFGRNALSLSLSKITLMTIPSSGTLDGRIVINRKATLERINRYFNLYSKDITDSLFDKNRVFCPDDEYSIGKYCDNSPEIDTIYTAQGIIDNSIDIPRF